MLPKIGCSRFRAALWALAIVVLLCSPGGPAFAGEKVFVYQFPSLPVSLDPAKSNNIQDDQVMWLLYDALTQLSADGTQMLPALAEHWDKSADGLTYTFRLRRNVHFHDGTLLDAEAVKASFERQYLPASPFYTSAPPNAYQGVLSGLIQDVRIIGPHSIAITTKYARPQQFALVKIVSPQALRANRGDLSRAPVGSGPFTLDRWDAASLTLAPFARSWHGRPRIDGVRFVTYPSDVVAERLVAGEVDLFLNVPPDFYEQVGGNPQLALVKFGGLNTMFFGMQLDRPALKDRRVREALVRGINRERLARVLGRGAMIPAQGPLPPNCGGFDPLVSQPAYDPEQARILLREAGGPLPLVLRLLYFSPLEVWSEIVFAVRADLEKIGIRLELKRASSWAEFYEERKKLDHDLYFYNWSISTPDPERLLYPLFHSQSPDNFGHFADARVDRLLAEARQPMGEARRLQLYGEVNRLVVGETPALFLVHRIGIAAVNSRVTGLSLNLYGSPQDKLATVEMR